MQLVNKQLINHALRTLLFSLIVACLFLYGSLCTSKFLDLCKYFFLHLMVCSIDIVTSGLLTINRNIVFVGVVEFKVILNRFIW